MDSVVRNLRQQAYFCGEFGSRFTCLLLLKAADDFEAGGLVSSLLAGHTGNATMDAVALRLAGALHAAVLTGRDPELAALYPASDPDWSMEKIWPVALSFLQREEQWVRDFILSPPQTNETGRSTGLVAGFMWLAQRAPQPFHMLELGASAGLNQNWDAFRFAFEPWGRTEGSGPLIPTRVDRGALPPWRDISIASSAGCDQNPIDIRDPDSRLRLRAYTWADQVQRLERLEAAIDLALTRDTRVDGADAAAWVAAKLEKPLPPGLTVIYHSVFFQYPPQEVRDAITNAIESAGERATPDAQLAWVRFEPVSLPGGPRGARYVLDVQHWDGAARTGVNLADVDPHGRFLVWRGE